MLVPVSWLKEYTDVDINVETFVERMILSGSNVETVSEVGESLDNIVVAHIKSIADLENSDHLKLALVDVGLDEDIQIVTGAPNVREDIYVPVALVGAKLPGGLKIKKAKLRGVESNGMMCSHAELGFADKVIPIMHKDGIWIMKEAHKPGTPIIQALELDDYVVEFEITPNRPDCLSIYGMARESAATFEKDLKFPDTKIEDAHGRASDLIKVKINRPDLCKRYVAKVVEDVTVEESPWWIQKRLMLAGMRPINNIVDITNYVLLELGHPIHAFDIENIESREIVVDVADDNTEFTTLDESVRKVDSTMLMIKDNDRPVAIAGVMGGLNSEVKKDSRTILIEAANFNQDSVRKTSKKLALKTEASARYEKGMDADLSLEAANRVCRLIELIGAGRVVQGAVDEYPGQEEMSEIEVRAERANAVLGTDIKLEEMKEIFDRLRMENTAVGNVIKVKRPSFRADLVKEIDLVEEIARIYGYDNLPITTHRDASASKTPYPRHVRDIACDIMLALGYNEIQTYSFTSKSSAEKILFDVDEKDYVELINPLGDETSVMRVTLLPNLIEVLSRNYKRGNKRALIFEAGNTFIKTDGDLPQEKYVLTAGAYGDDVDFFTMKGDLSELFTKLAIEGVEYQASASYKTFHPGRCAEILYEGKNIGVLGQVHPDIAEAFDINKDFYACEINLEDLIGVVEISRYYEPLPVYPTVERDISFITDEGLTVHEIEKTIMEARDKFLEDVTLFDVYRGEHVPQGKKSLAFNLIYRSKERTLTDEEVSQEHDKILKALKDKLGITLREN